MPSWLAVITHKKSPGRFRRRMASAARVFDICQWIWSVSQGT